MLLGSKRFQIHGDKSVCACVKRGAQSTENLLPDKQIQTKILGIPREKTDTHITLELQAM